MRSTLRCRCGQQASCRPLVQPVQHGPTLCHVVKQQHRLQRTFAAASDVDTSEATISDGRDPSGQRMKERLRKRVKTWRDSSSANTGLISINKGTNTAQAAACVAADFRDTIMTRLVAETPAGVAQAVSIIALATSMMNTPTNQQQDQPQVAADRADQQQQQREQSDADATPASQILAAAGAVATASHQVLVFQPVLISGMLVAPPQLPEGARALYTYKRPADEKTIQIAMRVCKRAAKAAAAAAADGSSSSNPSVVSVNATSDVREAGNVIANVIRKQGWVDLNCYGGPLATAKGIEAILAARGALGGQVDRKPLDVCAVFLDYYKKERSIAEQRQQQQEEQQKGSADDAEQQQQQQQEEVQEAEAAAAEKELLPHRCSRFLLLGCARNNPRSLQKLRKPK